MKKNCEPLFRGIEDGLKSKGKLTIGIDGPCASGKTSLAEVLKEKYGARVVPMDDFFLPANLRTAQRYSTPGGNIHYERFLEEVGPYLGQNNSELVIKYRPFDCSIMDYAKQNWLSYAPLTIVEGSYSLHPALRHLYDIKVLLAVDVQEQEKRLLTREGSESLSIFKSRWIPLENLYFGESNLEAFCDFIIEL